MAYFALLTAVFSVALGLGWLAVFLSVPVPAEMQSLGWEAVVIPLIPGIVLAFLGVQFFLEYRKTQPSHLLFPAIPLAVFSTAVVVGVAFILRSDEPALHGAFNWSLYLIPIELLAYKTEQILWAKEQRKLQSGDPR